MNKLQERAIELGLNLHKDTFESLNEYDWNLTGLDEKMNGRVIDTVLKTLENYNDVLEFFDVSMIAKHDSRLWDRHMSTMVGGRDYYEIWQILLVDWEPEFVILDEEKNMIVDKTFTSMADVYSQLVEMDRIWENNEKAQSATWNGDDEKLKKIMDKSLNEVVEEME